MTVLDFTGCIAAVCTTASYVPQVLKAFRSRSTRDLSLSMFIVLNTGIALWLAYGIGKSDIPLIGANVVTLALTGTVLLLKVRYG